MANIKLKSLITEAEDFQARSKQTGKLVHFKSKDSYDAAIKAGSHEDPKAKKGDEPKADAKPNDMFGGDYTKDRSGDLPVGDLQYRLQKNKQASKSEPTPKIVGNWKPDEDGKLGSDAADDVRNHLNDVLGVDGMAEIDYNTGNIQYGLSDGENSIFVGNEDGTYNVSFEGPSVDIDTINKSYKSFKNPKDALTYAGELAKANRKGLEQKYTDTADTDGQTDDELYDALYDMGYDFGELGSDDFDEDGFADAAISLGYRYDDKNKVWYNRDEMEESSTKLTSMIKKIKK